MNTKIPGQYWTYSEALFLFPSGWENQFNEWIKPTQVNVTPIAQKISNEGFKILTALRSVTPPSELIFPHEQIVSCIQFKVDYANDIIKMLEQYITPTRELGADPCGNYSNSLLAINAYLNYYGK